MKQASHPDSLGVTGRAIETRPAPHTPKGRLTMLSIGLDVYWRTSTFCILDENGKEIETQTVRGE